MSKEMEQGKYPPQSPMGQSDGAISLIELQSQSSDTGVGSSTGHGNDGGGGKHGLSSSSAAFSTTSSINSADKSGSVKPLRLLGSDTRVASSVRIAPRVAAAAAQGLGPRRNLGRVCP